MDKLKIKLVDRSFITCGPSAGTGETGITPKCIEWCSINCESPITVFTDTCLGWDVDHTGSKYNIGWIIESRAIMPHLYTNLDRYNKFDYVLTHDKQLLDISNKFVFVPLGGTWIKDRNIYSKNKCMSIIASSKQSTEGHKLRHSIVANCGESIDGLFGGGYRYIKDKLEGLKDYQFHIVVENIKTDYWFTEKLIDTFVTGTIPIYYGTPSIGKFFNTDGMLIFNNLDEFKMILDQYVNKEYYDYLLQSGVIHDNFNRAKEYLTPEDYMYNHLFKELL